MASTLATLLIKLGFDVSSLSSGGKIARTELESVGAAARKAGDMILPTTAALNNMARAVDSVKGSTGGTVALNNLAKAAQAVSTATGGSATAMNSFARAAATIGTSTQSGTALNAFAKAAAAVTTATGSPQVLVRFADAATKVAQAGTPAGVIAFSKAIESLAPAGATGAAGLKAIEAAAVSAKEAFAATAGAGGALTGAGLTTGAANAATGQLTAMGAAAAGAAGGVVDLAVSETNAAQEALDLLQGLIGTSGAADIADQAADDLSTGLDETGQSMNDASQASRGLSSNTVSLADALRSLASLLTVLLDLPTALGNIATAAGNVGEGLSDVSAAVNASGGPTGAFVTTLETIDQALMDTNQGLDNMESAFNEWAVAAGVTTALSSTLVGGFDTIIESVEELTVKLHRLLEAFQDLAAFQREQGGEGGIGGLGAVLPTPPQPSTGGGGGGGAAAPTDYDAAIAETERLLGLTGELRDRLDDLGSAGTQSAAALGQQFDNLAARVLELNAVDSMAAMHFENVAAMLAAVAEAATRGEPALGDLASALQILEDAMTNAETASAQGAAGIESLGEANDKVASLFRRMVWAQDFSGDALAAGLAAEDLGDKIDNLAGPARTASQDMLNLVDHFLNLVSAFKRGELDISEFQDGISQLGVELEQLSSIPAVFTEAGAATGSFAGYIEGLIDRLMDLGTGSEWAYTTMQQLIEVLHGAQAAAGTGNLQPFDITDVKAAEAALIKLEEAARKGALTNADVQAARDAFEAIRFGAADTTAVVEEVGQSAQAAFDIIAQAGEVAAAAGEQGATGFERMLQVLDEIAESSTVMMTMGNYVNTLKASLESWSTTGTGPISVDEMTRQVAIMSAYKEGLISAGDAVNRLANESAPAFDVLTAAEQAAGDAAGKAAADLRSLGTAAGATEAIDAMIARIEALREAVLEGSGPEGLGVRLAADVGSLESLEILSSMLQSFKSSAEAATVQAEELGTAVADLHPRNVTLLQGATAAIEAFEKAAEKGILTNQDAAEAYREFDLALLASTVELGQFNKAAGMTAVEIEQALTTKVMYLSAALLNLKGASSQASNMLDSMLNDLQQARLAATGLDDIHLSAFAGALQSLTYKAEDGVVTVDDLREAVQFYADMAARAEIITGSLGQQMSLSSSDAAVLAQTAQEAAEGLNAMARPMEGTASVEFIEEIMRALQGLTPATGEAAKGLSVLNAGLVTWYAQASSAGGVTGDINGRVADLASIVQYLGEHLSNGTVTIEAFEEAMSLFAGVTDEASASAQRLATSTQDLTYGQAVFDQLVDRVENFVGASDEAQSSLNRLRDYLIEISNAAGMGRTMDPNVIKAFTVAIEVLEAAQRQGVVTTEDMSRALAAQQAILNATGSSTQGLAAVQNALAAEPAFDEIDVSNARDMANAVEEIGLNLDMITPSGSRVYDQLGAQIAEIQMHLENIASGQANAWTPSLSSLAEMVEILYELSTGEIGAVEGAQQLAEALSTVVAVLLPSFEESAAAATALGNAIEAAGGKAAYIDQLINRVRALSGNVDATNGSLEDLQNTIQSLNEVEGVDDVMAQMVGLTAAVEELEARAQYGVVTLGDLRAAMVQGAEAAQRYDASLENAGENGLKHLSLDAIAGEAALERLAELLDDSAPPLEGGAKRAYDLAQRLYELAPASQVAAMSLLELMERLEAFFTASNRAQEMWRDRGNTDWLSETGLFGQTSGQDLIDMTDEINRAVDEIGTSAAPNWDAVSAAIDRLAASAKDGKVDVAALRDVLASMTGTAASASSSIAAATSVFAAFQQRLGEISDITNVTPFAGTTATVADSIFEMDAALSALQQGVQSGAISLEQAAQAATAWQAAVSSLEAADKKGYISTEELTAVLNVLNGTLRTMGVEVPIAGMAQLAASTQETAVNVALLIDELRQLVSTGQMPADVAQPMIDGLKEMRATLSTVDEEFVAWVQKEVAAAKQLGAGLSESQMDAAQTAQFLGSMLKTLTSDAGPARVVLESLTAVLREWAATGTGNLSQMADLFALLEQIGAVGPAMLPEGVEPKIINEADYNAIVGFLASLKEIQPAADATTASMTSLEQAMELNGIIGQDLIDIFSDYAGQLERANVETGEAAETIARLQRAMESISTNKPTAEMQKLFDMYLMLDRLGATGYDQTKNPLITAADTAPIKAYLDSLDQLAPAAIESAQALQAEATAADDTSRALHGAAKAAHEAKVARDALAAASGGGAGVPPTPPAPPTGPTPPDDFGPMYQRLANLLAQLQAVRASAAATVPPLAAVAAAGGAAGAGAAAAAAGAAAATPPLAGAAGAAVAAGVGLNAAGAAAAGAAPPINNVAGAAGNAANNLGGIPPQANAAAASMNNVAHSAGNASDRASFLNRTLSMAFAFSGGVAVTNVIGFITDALIGFNSRLEQTRIGFATFMGSTELADAFIKKMQAFADITPFEFTGLRDSVQRLMAMGFAADHTLTVLQAVGDAVAATGGNAEKLDRITVALGQMYTAGKVNAQDMRQLTEAMIPAWKMLADHMGVSVSEARKAVTDGLVPASEGIEAVLRGMEKSVAEGGFGGMMAKQARTAAGALSTLHDVALRTISSAIEPLFNAIAAGMVALADFLVTGGTKFVIPAIYAIGAAIGLVAVPKIIGMIASASAATVTLGGLSAAEIAAAQAAHVAAGGVGTLAVAVGGLTIPILPLIVAVTTLGIAWQENVGGIRDSLQPALKGLGEALGAVGSLLGQVGINAAFLMKVVVALAAAITTKLIVSLTIALGRMALTVAMSVKTALGFGAVAVGSTAAAGGVALLHAALTRLLAVIGGVAGIIGLFVAAGVLLITNFDQVTQGVRALTWGILGLAEGFISLFSSVPLLSGWAKDAVAAIQNARAKIVAEMASMEAEINRKKTESEAAALAGAVPGYDLGGWDQKLKQMLSEMENSTAVDNAASTLVEKFGTTIKGVVEAAKDAGGKAMTEMAKAILDKQNEPVEALKALREIVATQLSPTEEIARLVGMRASAELAEGLADTTNPARRAQAEGLVKFITERLDQLTNNAYSAGLAGADGLTAGFWDGMQGQDLGTLIGLAPIAVPVQPHFVPPDASEVADAMAKLNASLADEVDTSEAVEAFVNSFSNDLSQLDELGRTAGAEMLQGVADGIQSRQNAPLDKMKNLREMLKTQLSVTTQIALLYGAYISQDLANGLASEDPAVRAAALATRKSITDQLDVLTDGAFSAGTNTAKNLAAGIANNMSQKLLSAAGMIAGNSALAGFASVFRTVGTFLGEAAAAQFSLKNAWDDAAPSAAAATKAYNQWAASLDNAKSSADSYASAMKSAMESVASQARTFFQKLHDDNLKAIDDANKLKNTLLQKPVTAQQEWLNARQKAIQEANLRRAVTTATSPDQQLSAVQALKEFLLQKQIDANQAAVDTQVNLNNDLTEKAKAAEDTRYQNQLNSFDKQMRALQDYLATHRVTWQVAQAKVIDLLRRYGINYRIAGARLGFSFEQGLRDSITGVIEAAKDLGSAAADAIKPWVDPVKNPKKEPKAPAAPTVPVVPRRPSVPSLPGRGLTPVPYDTGSWKLLTDTLALVHQGEMIVPATIADSVRDLIKTGRSSSLVPLSSAGADLTGATSTGSGLSNAMGRSAAEGGGTIIVQIGNEVIDEIVDRRLYVRGTIYRQTSSPPSGSLR